MNRNIAGRWKIETTQEICYKKISKLSNMFVWLMNHWCNTILVGHKEAYCTMKADAQLSLLKVLGENTVH